MSASEDDVWKHDGPSWITPLAALRSAIGIFQVGGLLD
jgi:hypothetical protein